MCNAVHRKNSNLIWCFKKYFTGEYSKYLFRVDIIQKWYLHSGQRKAQKGILKKETLSHFVMLIFTAD